MTQVGQLAPIAQQIEQIGSNDEVEGANPSGGAFVINYD